MDATPWPETMECPVWNGTHSSADIVTFQRRKLVAKRLGTDARVPQFTCTFCREIVMPRLDASLLIADADAQSCGRLRDFFSRFGFAVETASNGLECLGKLRTLEPDVLILELNMPWGGGDGVVARLHEDLCLDEPPAVLVIGNGSPETLAARAGLPRADCYPKPVRMERMIDSVCLAIALAEERRSRARPESTHVV